MAAEGSTGSRAARLLQALLPWAISLGILAFVLGSQDLDALGEALARGRWLPFLGALASFLIVGLLIDTAFFTVMFRWLEGVGSFRELLRARAASEMLMLINFVAGFGGLAVYVRRRYGLSWKTATGAMLVEMLHDLAALGTLALIGTSVVPRDAMPPEAAGALDGVRWFAIGSLSFYGLCVVAALLWRRLPRRFQYGSVLQIFLRIEPHWFVIFWAMRCCKACAIGLFAAAGLACFGLGVPILTAMGFTQIVMLVRSLPVSAFGVGVDQLTIPALFGPWDSAAQPGQVMAFAVVFTGALLVGRALMGLPFIQGITREIRAGADRVESP